MIYTLVVENSSFGVNRDFREIDLSDLDPQISTVQYDTNRKTGVIEWKSDVVDYIRERDLEAEQEAYDNAVKNNLQLSTLQPIHKATPVRRPRKVIDAFDAFAHLLIRWRAAEPAPEPEPTPVVRPPLEERVRLIEVVRLLRRKGILTAEDIEYLKSTVQET